jgi:hypothetical protein
MFSLAMSTIPITTSERVYMTLSVALLAACVANMTLICVWL